MQIVDGWLTGVPRVPSPNQDARPLGADIRLVVVHGISLPPGEFGGPWVEHLFTNSLPAGAHPYFAPIADIRVSSHLFIRRDGSMLQFVPFTKRAWHAGASSWRGTEGCNDFSIGIELEGCDTVDYATPQYETLAGVVTVLQAEYPQLGADGIVGHADIAPGRKSDPGPAFRWDLLTCKLPG